MRGRFLKSDTANYDNTTADGDSTPELIDLIPLIDANRLREFKFHFTEVTNATKYLNDIPFVPVVKMLTLSHTEVPAHHQKKTAIKHILVSKA